MNNRIKKLWIDLIFLTFFRTRRNRSQPKHFERIILTTYRINLIECLPPLLWGLDILDGLYGPLHPRGPDPQAGDLLLVDVIREGLGVLSAARREVAVAADTTHYVVCAFAMLQDIENRFVGKIDEDMSSSNAVE